MKKKVIEKSRECHNHKPQPFSDTKRKRKQTKPSKRKSNKRTKSTKISSLYPKPGIQHEFGWGSMSEKPQLPLGWVVRQSKSYPDRVYYFNLNTGASTWEFPDLLKAYNVSSAGPVSPPILSATSLKPGKGTAVIQSPPKHPPEPSFSPVEYSSSDNDGSPAFGRRQNNERRNYKMPSTPGRPATYVPKQAPKQPQSIRAVNERVDLLKPIVPPVNNKPLALGKIPGNATSGRSVLGRSSIGSGGFCDKSPTGLKKTSMNSPLELNRINSICSDLERYKTAVAKSLGNPMRTSTLQPSSSEIGNQSLENLQVNKSLKDQISKSSCPVTDSDVSVTKLGKTVKQLGKLINQQGAKVNTQVDSSSRLSEKKTIDLSSVNKRKSLEKDINDNIKNIGKKRGLDRETINQSEREVKKRIIDNSGLIVQSKALESSKTRKPSLSPVKNSESKSVKRKSSEILHRESKVMNLDDSTDKRKVVRNSVVDSGTSRSVVLKSTPVKFGTNSEISEDLKVHAALNISQSALSSSRSFTRQVSEDSNLSLDPPNDPDQSGILRQFIGDKDKLLSIQSWIDNLRDGAGSSNASVDSFSESVSGDADDKRVVVSDKSTDCDSGYLSPPVKKTTARTERGWPGDVKKSDIMSREITAMEVDDITVELPEGDVLFEEEDMVVDLMLSEVREQMKICPEKVCGTLTATVTELQEFMTEQEYQQKLKGVQTIPAQTGVISPFKKQLYVVIDTNVIINDLTFVEELKNQEITGYGKPVLYIPWIVLQELDSLKQAYTKGMPKLTNATQNKANRGIKLLQNMFRLKHPQVKGQTPIESQEAAREFTAECNDDIILMTCLHINRKTNSMADVVLLTNDNNLINKALVCGVPAYSRKDVLAGIVKLKERVSPRNSVTIIPTPVLSTENVIPISGKSHSIPTPVRQSNTDSGSLNQNPGQSSVPGSSCLAQGLLEEERKYTDEQLAEEIHCKLKDLLKAGLAKVLQIEMELAYSDMWQEIVYRKPPWSLTNILESIKKHWIAVFGQVFQRNVQNHVDYLLKNFTPMKVYSIAELGVCTREATLFLNHCVTRNMYGTLLKDIRNRIHCIQSLCDSVVRGEINVQNISSLENYLQIQLSSQQKSNCDISANNTCLVNKNSVETLTPVTNDKPYCISSQPHSTGSQNNISVPSPAIRNQMSPQSPVIVSGGQLQQIPEIWELAARKLQKIWQHIYTCCDQMRRMLNTGMDEKILSAVEMTLSLLVPVAKEIRTAFVVVLQLPLSHLPGHMDKIGNLANQCNNFYSTLQLNDEDPPVDAESFLSLFRNGKQRDSLNLFLSQLDEMLCHLYKCLYHLDPGD